MNVSELDIRYQAERRRDFENNAARYREAQLRDEENTPKTEKVSTKRPMNKVAALVYTILNVSIR